MFQSSFRIVACLSLLTGSIALACSFQVPDEDKVFSSGAGGQATGGLTNTPTTGGAPGTNGGNSALGGSAPSLAGASSTGGAGGSNVAGSSTSGGATGTTASTGGTVSGGAGTSGGTLATGGAATTIGTGGTGVGVTSTGGAATGGATGLVATGGAGTGGAAPTGGFVSTGGTNAAGGTIATGGVANTGGALPAGGSDTGGATYTGGATATGGALSTGGEPGTGGTPPTPPKAILQYRFEELAGPTVLDATENHNDGTLAGAAWSTLGRNGGGVSYASADSVVTAPNGFLGSAHTLTVAAWVYLTSNTAENRLFYFGDGSTYLTLALNNSINGISLRFQGPTGAEQLVTTPTQLPLSVWKHIAVTVSGAGSAIYVDGKVVAQNAAMAIDTATLGTTTSNLVGSSPTAGQAFQGRLDEFYVYDGVLPMSDIRQLAWPKSDYSIYHFDEGTGLNTADSSDRAINGTIVGGATWISTPLGKGINLVNTTTAPAQQYVDLADGIVAPCGLNVTITGWFNLTTNNTDARFFEFAQDATHYINFTTYTTSYAQPVFSFGYLNATDRTLRIRPYTSWVPGIWTHIAIVRTGTTANLFHDGVKVITNGPIGTSALLSTWGSTTSNFIGKSVLDTVPGFNGAVDEILVSCRNYTDDEIKQLAYLPK